jgi:GNAT superfamily N-acetyltransferase
VDVALPAPSGAIADVVDRPLPETRFREARRRASIVRWRVDVDDAGMASYLGDMATIEVVRTFLELRNRDALAPVALPGPTYSLRREAPCSVVTSRDLYARVGHPYHWHERDAWGDVELARYLSRAQVSVWVLRDADLVAGFFELLSHDDGSIEIALFGLLGEYHGRGLGRYLLTRAAEEAWRSGANRVWLHTCTLDGPAALPNYLARGFVPFRTETYTTAAPAVAPAVAPVVTPTVDASPG